MKKMFFIFHGRYPSEKAAALFAAKSCEAFAEQGIAVTLLVPRRLGRVHGDSFEYYNLKKNFTVVILPTLDVFLIPFLKKFAFHISFIVFSVSCFFYLMFRARRSDVVYSNESLPLFLALVFLPNIFYEVHDFPEQKFWFYGTFLTRARWVLATNSWKKDALAQKFGIAQDKIICEPNGVSVEEFSLNISKEIAREKLGLPLNGKLAVYTGHLYSWKGVDTLAEAARYLPADLSVVFVGGTEKDVARFRQAYGDINNIVIVGHRDHAEIPLWQAAADVLVLPNTAKEAISEFYTSPLKMFEYMASERPVVASDIASISEVLHEGNAMLVLPDDPKALAGGIERILRNGALAGTLAAQARADVRRYAWSERAKRIVSFLMGR